MKVSTKIQGEEIKTKDLNQSEWSIDHQVSNGLFRESEVRRWEKGVESVPVSSVKLTFLNNVIELNLLGVF